MKIMPGSWKRHYIAKVGVFLIAVVLTIAAVSCGGPAPKYSLTMAPNPVGGGTATDLTGASPYTANTAVNIKAVANTTGGYQFANWTAPVGTFGNATAAITTFTMPAQNVTVTANFVSVYGLTMAVAPPGSGNATDLTGASPYAAGTVVNIQAVDTAGLAFANWTAPAGT